MPPYMALILAARKRSGSTVELAVFLRRFANVCATRGAARVLCADLTSQELRAAIETYAILEERGRKSLANPKARHRSQREEVLRQYHQISAALRTEIKRRSR